MRILLADDDAALRRVLQFKLERRGFEVTAVEDGEQALNALRTRQFELLLTDMKMPKLSGLQLLERSKKLQPDLEVILITAYATVPQAVEAVKLGAFDYLTKPFDDELLFVTIDKAVRFKRLQSENKQLKEQLRDSSSRQLTGISAPYRELLNLIDKIAPSDATVLITGESGTGKELVARTIHRKSLRSDGEFIAVNCAAIPRELLESELFGHVKGSFTGAVRDKRGRFELARGGTLLLDEIGDLPFDLQAKLLRALQERVIEPVGAEQPIETDVRLLAATNVNLKDRVATGAFREDLFYRLSVIPLRVSSLRERVDDIEVLARTFVDKFARGHAMVIDPVLLETLKNHSWPGNVRELENLIERLVVLRKSDVLTVDDLPSEFYTTERLSVPDVNDIASEGSFFAAEKKLIVDALNRFGWNRTQAAKFLKIPRHILIYRMKKFGLSDTHHATAPDQERT